MDEGEKKWLTQYENMKYIPPQITLRSYFAAAALQGTLSANPTGKIVEGDDMKEKLSKFAVEMADAMIAEMNKEANK